MSDVATQPRPLVILGPTAGGKSELAVELAERLGGQVVNADSMQVYRDMDAGTAKPEPELRRRVPHHLIDVVDPTEAYSASDWVAAADGIIEDLKSRGTRPIVVGGTNLYLKLLLEGMLEGPPASDALRDELARVSSPELHKRLQRVDPDAAERIHVNDRKRLVRALEVFTLTGTPISRLQTQWREAAPGDGAAYRHDCVLVGLQWSTERINRRINARVKRMFHPETGDWPGESLPEETRRLLAAGRLGPQAREALGYKQVVEALERGQPMSEAMERTKVLTRRFAKQQRTWLRRYRGVHWVTADEADLPKITESILRFLAARDAAG